MSYPYQPTFRYYIIQKTGDGVFGTDQETVAQHYANDEDFTVIDIATDNHMMDGELFPIEDIGELES